LNENVTVIGPAALIAGVVDIEPPQNRLIAAWLEFAVVSIN
jgi:hypothetical protein